MMILVCKKNINIKMCSNFFKKLLGFMFKKEFNYGICIKKCNSIHTFFMRRSIDVIMTNKDNKILYIFNNLKKNKIILPKKGVYFTYELPTGYNNYNIGDYLIFKENVL